MYDVNRRRFLGATVLLSGSLASSKTLFAKSNNIGERRLKLYNAHTSEKLDLVYWQDGSYIEQSAVEINAILRDHRRNEIHDMDLALLDSLNQLYKLFDKNATYTVYSGYRSPETNQMLRKKNKGVAAKSLHMEGRAIDITLPGVRLSHLHKAALAMKSGGVGYYKKSGFIHIDTGPVRRWGK